jgi:hypothetical protein
MRTLVLLAAMILSATPAVAQDTAAAPRVFRGRIVGVFDETTGEPIEGAEVRNMLNGMSSLTTATGTLSLFFVDTTGGMISIRKVGYEPQTMVVSNSVRDSTGLTVVMRRTAQTLPTVVTKAKGEDSVPHYISPALRGFEERRKAGFGRFVTEADLRKRDNSRLSEVIRALVPGAAMVPGPGSAVLLTGHRAGGSGGRAMQPGRCYVTVYVDGAMIYSLTQGPPATNPPPDFSAMMADTYAGIEFYAGGASVPVQYNKTDAGCGTLLLWTRER